MRQYLPSIGTSGSRITRSRAILAAAVAASLLLPFSGGSATVASAAPTAPSAVTVRAESPDGLVHLALVPGENQAKYILSVSTLGQPAKPAACATKDVTGEIVLNPDGSIAPDLSKVVVDQRTFHCESPLSDTRAQTLLQTDKFPFAEFKITSAPGLGVPLAAGDTAFQLAGDQTVKGVTQPTTYDTTANMTPDEMTGLARTTLKMTSFGITPPSIGPLVRVSDDMVAEVNLKALVSSPPAP
ncbi:MAG: YceI family protein [Chloroflexota bacterium]